MDTKDVNEHNWFNTEPPSLAKANADKSELAFVKTLANQSKQTRAAIEHQTAQNARCELYGTLWEQPCALGAAVVDAAHRFGWFPRLQANRAEPRIQSTGGSSRSSSDRRRGVARAQIR